jgi:hypothetical protein
VFVFFCVLQMEEVHQKLELLQYPRASAPSQSLLYAGLERYELLQWLFFRLLGDKSPFTQQALLGDGADRDEEAARIQCNKSFFSLVAFCFGHTPNSISKKNSCDPIEE